MATGILHEALRTEERGVDWRAATAGALVSAGPLAVGLALDETVAGITAAIGGLNTALGVPRATLRVRFGWGALCAVVSAGSLAVGDLTSAHTWAFVLATFAWIAAWATLRAAGPTGALCGFAIGAVLVILGGVPVGDASLDERLLWYSMGAVPGLALMVAARTPRAAPSPVGRVGAGVRAALRVPLHDPVLRAHALRAAAAVAGATLLYRVADLPHGYWVPLTVLAVLQPERHATRVRGAQRTLGTLGGAVLIIGVTLVTDDRWVLVTCAAAAAFWLFALTERGYFWLVVMLTPTALLMLSVVSFQGDDIALERIAESAVGIAIGLAIGELVGWWSTRRGPAPSWP